MKDTRNVRLIARIFCLTILPALLIIPGVRQTALAEDGDDLFKALQITQYAERQEVADFTLEATDGEKHTLSDYKGSVILLNFWTTW